MTGPKKILEWAKGFRGRAKNCISIARERVEKGLQYAYRDRRTLKRDIRSLWIQQINAGAREHGVRSLRSARRLPRHCRQPVTHPRQLKYSQLIHGLAAENIVINRKALALLAQNEPLSFKVREQGRRWRWPRGLVCFGSRLM